MWTKECNIFATTRVKQHLNCGKDKEMLCTAVFFLRTCRPSWEDYSADRLPLSALWGTSSVVERPFPRAWPSFIDNGHSVTESGQSVNTGQFQSRSVSSEGKVLTRSACEFRFLCPKLLPPSSHRWSSLLSNLNLKTHHNIYFLRTDLPSFSHRM